MHCCPTWRSLPLRTLATPRTPQRTANRGTTPHLGGRRVVDGDVDASQLAHGVGVTVPRPGACLGGCQRLAYPLCGCQQCRQLDWPNGAPVSG